ncbi:MAG: hypothetical protein HYY85_19170 [Deltaproteobacteria bacterium]|nr:hypothetical protein [Deltaproteobacteria bacterium]
MRCIWCDGLLLWETIFSDEGRLDFWRCVMCARVTGDPVIEANRQHQLRGRGHRKRRLPVPWAIRALRLSPSPALSGGSLSGPYLHRPA